MGEGEEEAWEEAWVEVEEKEGCGRGGGEDDSGEMIGDGERNASIRSLPACCCCCQARRVRCASFRRVTALRIAVRCRREKRERKRCE